MRFILIRVISHAQIIIIALIQGPSVVQFMKIEGRVQYSLPLVVFISRATNAFLVPTRLAKPVR